MIGDGVYREYAGNTFSKQGLPFPQFSSFTPMKSEHYVHPHDVSSYTKKDGTFVKGFWRDGDGNTDVNRDIGYFAGNPNPILKVITKDWGTK